MKPCYPALVCLLLMMCAAVTAADDFANDFADIPVEEEAVPADTADSQLEHFNRLVFEFNDVIDRSVLKPVAKGYDKVVPGPVNRGITHFFSNIGELPSALNALLQGKPLVAGDNFFRFLINTTFGVLGFSDAATRFGIDEQKEDFGQTLAVWGVPAGPYLVLPFFGPSSFRDAPARLGDSAIDPISYVDSFPTYMAARTADIVDSRADLLKAERLITGDRYLFLKNAYQQRREYLILDGQVEDTFNDGEFDDDGWLDE